MVGDEPGIGHRRRAQLRRRCTNSVPSGAICAVPGRGRAASRRSAAANSGACGRRAPACPAGRSRRKSRLLRHADLLADQPARRAPRSVGPARRRRDGHRQQHLAGIGVGHHRPLGDARAASARRSGRPSRPAGSVSVEFGRDAGIARVAPIGVPARRQPRGAGRRGTASPGATASVSETSVTVARGLMTGALSSARAGGRSRPADERRAAASVHRNACGA